jgi:ATP-dependent RNA helicase DHX29
MLLLEDSECCHKFLEEEKEITINVISKAGDIKLFGEHISVGDPEFKP